MTNAKATSNTKTHAGKHAHFSPDALRFLHDLDVHNERDWFNAHKERFESSLHAPYLAFLTDLAPRLERVSPRFKVDPKPVGGSLARIYKDMRFVRDGLPFKTALSAHFAHEKAKPGAQPSFYMALAPGKSFVAGGVRNPDADATKRLKAKVLKEEARWRKVRAGLDVDRFVAKIAVPDVDVASPHFVTDVVAACKRLAPFVEFVTEAVGLRM
jgi:uncharacterized protein (TIGR02453 family)